MEESQIKKNFFKKGLYRVLVSEVIETWKRALVLKKNPTISKVNEPLVVPTSVGWLIVFDTN